MGEVQEWADGLHALADFAEAHPEGWPTHSMLCVNFFVDNADELGAKAREFGGAWAKVDSAGFYNLRKYFGPHFLDVCGTHAAICERVQVGTEIKQVPDPDQLAAVPTVEIEEPVYEWKCPDSILSLSAEGDD